jgi:hypothetical protein
MHTSPTGSAGKGHSDPWQIFASASPASARRFAGSDVPDCPDGGLAALFGDKEDISSLCAM